MSLLSTLVKSQAGLIKPLQGGRLYWSNSSELIWKPFKHGSVCLWNGNSWVVVTKSTQVSFPISFSSFDVFGLGLGAGINYDVYLRYLSSSNFDIVLASWATDTTPAYRVSADGVIVAGLENDLKKCRLVGSVRLYNNSGTLQLMDGINRRFIINLDNVLYRPVEANPNAVNMYTSNSTTGSEFSMVNRGEFLCIHPGISVTGFMAMYTNGQVLCSNYTAWTLCLNSITQNCGPKARTGQGSQSYSGTIHILLRETAATVTYAAPQLGYNWISIIIFSDNASIPIYGGIHGWGHLLIPT
jgi:hypothetical protein